MNKKKMQSCYFVRNGIAEIDYTDVELLKRFLNENFKIIAMSYSGVSPKYQKQLSAAVKRARFLGLLPYCDYHRQSF